MVTMKILIINGPNLNLILQRNKEYYGDKDIDSIKGEINKYFPNIEISLFTSNSENDIIDKIQGANEHYDGLIINPGAYTHTSVGIRDALEICKIPKIEVHLSNISSRDTFRKTAITTPACNGYIAGFKSYSYLSAVFLIKVLKENNANS